MSAFNPDTFFQDAVNQHCDLPELEGQEAFDLYYAATGLVSALTTFRRLVPELGSRELQRLVRSLGRRWGVAELAAAVVRMVANVQACHRSP